MSYRSTADLAFLAGVSKDAAEGNLFMVERQADHLNWVHGLDLYLLGSQEFTGQLDHTKCRLGEWLYDSQRRQALTDNQLQGLLAQLENPHAPIHESARKILDAKQGGNEQAARDAFLNVTLPALRTTTECLNRIRQRYQAIRAEQGGKAAEDLTQHASGQRSALLIMGSLGLILAAAVSLLVSRSTGKVLGSTVHSLSEVAQQVASASGQVSSSSQALAQGASEQAASIEETSASAEEITSRTRKNAENSRTAAEQMVATAAPSPTNPNRPGRPSIRGGIQATRPCRH